MRIRQRSAITRMVTVYSVLTSSIMALFAPLRSRVCVCPNMRSRVYKTGRRMNKIENNSNSFFHSYGVERARGRRGRTSAARPRLVAMSRYEANDCGFRLRRRRNLLARRRRLPIVFARHLDAVSPVCLGDIERLVGDRQKRVDIGRGIRGDRNPGGERSMHRKTVDLARGL